MMHIFRAYFKNFFNFIIAPVRTLAGFLRRAVPGLKWLASLKTETLVASLTFVFLTLLWVFIRLLPSISNAADDDTQLSNALLILGLIIGITAAIYFFLKVALAPPKSPFPDIDESWEAGLTELEKAGLNVRDLPLYLVLGMKDTKRVRAFMEASGKEFDVEGATGSGQTLLWYGSKDHVFVFLSDVGNFTEFTNKSQRMPLMHSVEEKDFTSTANISQFYKVSDAVVDDAPAPEEMDEKAIMSTVRATDMMPSASDAEEPRPAPARERDTKPMQETARAKTGEQRKRINHLSGLIRKSRTPVSPANGLVVNADVNVLESYPEEMARKLRDDLRGISAELGILCATTVIVSGLESDQGFINFAERLVEQNGSEFGKSKFGKSYRTWTPPTDAQLEQVATGAVEEFDHFMHLIFTKRDALSGIHVQGNRDLVLFICRLYSSILPGLRVLLSKGCSLPESATEVEFPRFAGCYFIGNDSQSDYFLEKVFDRIEENQGELEWTPRALQEEDRWRMMGSLGYFVGLCSLIAFVFLLVFDWK